MTLGWTGTRNFLYKRPALGAQVAQLVEQRTENPCVGGSIPPLGTIGASVVGSALCSCPPRVEALDGFDADTFSLSTSPRDLPSSGQNSIAGTTKNIRRGSLDSGLLSAGCYVDFKGRRNASR